MASVLGISGSLRAGSFNGSLLRAAIELAPEGCKMQSASIRGIPLYDGDVETESGIPAAVTALKEQIIANDALLLVTPEYNNSIPGVFKNAIDWLSRPPADIARVFRGRPVGLIGASPGPGGSGLAQVAWLPVLRTLGMRPWFGGRLTVGNAGSVFDASGKLIDDKVRGQLKTFMDGFAKDLAR